MSRLKFCASFLLILCFLTFEVAAGPLFPRIGRDRHSAPTPRYVPEMVEPPGVAPVPAERPKQISRKLSVKNTSSETLMVFVYYRAKTEKNSWVWLPGADEPGSKALRFEVPPGTEAPLYYKDAPILASRVRIWAMAETSGTAWTENKDTDLWLVPELEDDEHCYRAAEIENFTVPFPS